MRNGGTAFLGGLVGFSSSLSHPPPPRYRKRGEQNSFETLFLPRNRTIPPSSFVGGHKHRNSAIGLSHYNKKGPKTGELLWPSRYLIVELTRPRNKKYPSRIFPHDIFFEKKYTWGERRLSHLLHEGNDQEEAPTSEFIMVIRPGRAE